MKIKKQRIKLSDGRRGYQVVDKAGELHSVVITREADGTKCRHVYGWHSDLMAKVYSMCYLGNVTWDLVD